jgi:hypothetical protein
MKRTRTRSVETSFQGIAGIGLAGAFLLLAAMPAAAEAPAIQLRAIAPGGIAIYWEHEDDGAAGITLQREDPGYTWNFVALSNSFVDLGLQASRTYRYRACAIYGQPDCTDWLAAQTLAAPPPPSSPGVPAFTSSSATADSITVNWTSSSNYGFYNVRWAEDGFADGQNKVDSGQSFTVGGLRPGTYHFIVQGCDRTLLGSSCSYYSAPYEVSTLVPLPPPPPPAPIWSKGVIYGLTLNDDLFWYRHDGFSDGSPVWEPWKQVGVGWSVRQIFGSGNIIYAVMDNGNLDWFRHLGREDGSFRWEGPHTVGYGWGGFRELFSGGEDIIYGITPVIQAGVQIDGTTHAASGGDLLWYRHVGQPDGSFRWLGPMRVGIGWGGLTKVFSGGKGIIYGIQENGDLVWYRHLGREDGSFRWEGPHTVGYGWGGFTKVFSGGDGVIYATLDNGEMLWYRHDGWTDGSFRWAYPAGKAISSGWYKFIFRQVFAD